MASKIAELSSVIARNTASVDEYIRSHNLSQPSFDVDSPVDLKLPDGVEEARVAAIDASQELNDLLRGPIALVRPVVSRSPNTKKSCC